MREQKYSFLSIFATSCLRAITTTAPKSILFHKIWKINSFLLLLYQPNCTHMKRLFTLLLLCCATIMVSCDKETNETDQSTVYFEQEEFTLPAEGGEVIIPVISTGVDYVAIKHTFDDAWTFTSDGNMVPRPSWIEVEVIPNYPESRALMMGRSGIKLTVEANTSIANRVAWLIVGSYSDTATILLRQQSVTVK